MAITYDWLKENIKTLDEFQELLSNYQFLNEQSSYQEYMVKMEEMNSFFHFARRTGFPFLRMFIQYQFLSLEILRKEKEESKRMVEYYKQEAIRAHDTGDEEFDQFRDDVRHFDRYWDYSDDSGVRRRGLERENKLKKIIDDKTKAGDERYRNFFNYVMKP